MQPLEQRPKTFPSPYIDLHTTPFPAPTAPPTYYCTGSKFGVRGEKKAVLVGINYFNKRGQLRGCVDDVKNMAAYLNLCFGYDKKDMVILTDDQRREISKPTKINILRAITWLVKDAKPGDSLIFYYSGHGRCSALDENEDICPLDFNTAGFITSDECQQIMTRALSPGVSLSIILDTRHPENFFVPG
ncbi:uncharacterized protein Z519_12097 [Cladophialophora bantiana CBS 173.52]|uniref:Peptidase C14 caspase domain-containing protein n=1 Tax=Cladophialophora bantiana (strain ATCC 10958 / CBS 173.52 / CDC B-1940 / NIH 8579) TaxID=1442370 RepID=A0A0D2H8G5_CLAB1|nr:uncharacterized protein Z519_12097 [Cladophialophora bantiana CBS 173.52]KIW87195.1 hypothetical protein Z519_12097 [Cladophialophora bantiana CBS 173.52]